VIHQTRRGLLAASGLAACALILPTGLHAQSRNVVDTMAGDGRFNRFLELIGRAGGTDQLRGAGPMTVFAPTDAAFDGPGGLRTQELLSEGGTGNLSSSPDPVRLRAFVEFYVLAGQAMRAAQFTGDQQVKTVSGGVLRINTAGGKVAISNANLSSAPKSFGAGGINVEPPAALSGPEIIATNGVIHPITQILFP